MLASWPGGKKCARLPSLPHTHLLDFPCCVSRKFHVALAGDVLPFRLLPLANRRTELGALVVGGQEASDIGPDLALCVGHGVGHHHIGAHAHKLSQFPPWGWNVIQNAL